MHSMCCSINHNKKNYYPSNRENLFKENPNKRNSDTIIKNIQFINPKTKLKNTLKNDSGCKSKNMLEIQPKIKKFF